MDFLYKKELDIINNINAAILYCKNDEFSTILYANQYFYDLIGYTKKEMETIFNNRFADLVIDDVSEILVKVEEIISKGENLDFEFRMRRKDNSIIWLHDTAVYNKENNTFYVTLMDITYMKSIEYQKEKLNNYLNNITNKVIITDINGIIEYKNNEAENNDIYPKINENIKLIQMNEALLKQLCSTENPQGIVGVINMQNKELKSGELVVLVDKVQDPGNMGTIIRTAHAAGAAGIVMTKGTVDIYNDKTLRSTMGSIFYIPIVEDDSLDFVKSLKKEGYKLVVSSLQGKNNFF